ncbi:hypothetical protein ACJ73_08974 [Blastomyces percursus]|uniref:Uncharacterized protein n=1 Tax=Blastomyces percursus TaxID=1658174 RepID=A0A1J9PGI4_9EURO|nr:hypothetical protein ACJ73_08974 [Blastomyces percursus]
MSDPGEGPAHPMSFDIDDNPRGTWEPHDKLKEDVPDLLRKFYQIRYTTTPLSFGIFEKVSTLGSHTHALCETARPLSNFDNGNNFRGNTWNQPRGASNQSKGADGGGANATGNAPSKPSSPLRTGRDPRSFRDNFVRRPPAFGNPRNSNRGPTANPAVHFADGEANSDNDTDPDEAEIAAASEAIHFESATVSPGSESGN